MTFKNKKDPTVTATLDFEDEKFKTVTLIYLTGPNAGKSFSVNQSTLKRWWTKIEPEEVKVEKKKSKKVEKEEVVIERPKFLDTIDYEQVNTPYPEPKEQKYIPVPDSVIEYEEKKRRTKKAEYELPKNYEEFADILAKHKIKIKNVNTGYISLPDNSKLKLQKLGIALLASNDIGEKLVKKGYTCRPCIEKGTPFRFDFLTQDSFDDMLEVLSSENE